MDPIVPALSAASETAPSDPTAPIPLLDPLTPLPAVERSALPQCPSCGSLQRPGVVWFGESLDHRMLAEIDVWIYRGPVDLIFVVGTSAQVAPASSYVMQAARAGAKICVVNPDIDLRELRDEDFAFEGDAAELLPMLLEPVIGKMREDGTFE